MWLFPHVSTAYLPFLIVPLSVEILHLTSNVILYKNCQVLFSKMIMKMVEVCCSNVPGVWCRSNDITIYHYISLLITLMMFLAQAQLSSYLN